MAISAGNGSARLTAPAVIVAGEIFLDLLLIGVDHWPEPGKEIFAREFRREIGGGTAITACALARLGCPAAVLGAIGTDSSAWITSRLESCGVNTGSVIVDSTEPTGISVIASRPEDRLFITYRGANRRLAELLESWVETCQDPLLHVHLAVPLDFESGPRIIDAIRRRNALVSLDVGWNRGWLLDPRAWEIARQIDVFFPNAVEAEALTGER
jgi:sugar/nucleoside kinase (ribokinase family)